MNHSEYRRITEGARTAVLFIHGFMGSPAHFREFEKKVPESMSALNILLPGHGGSMSEFSHSGMEKWKESAQKAVKELCETHDSLVIVAHSMGTFFAMQAAIDFPEKIKALYLLVSPLCVGLKFRAFLNGAKTMLGLVGEGDKEAQIVKTACGLELEANPFAYIGFIPRYFELFAEMGRMKKELLNVKCPVTVLQSARDELVARRSEKYLAKNEGFKLYILEKSSHYVYDEADKKIMSREFEKTLDIVKE